MDVWRESIFNIFWKQLIVYNNLILVPIHCYEKNF